MIYTISKTKRNLIFFCAVFLLLKPIALIVYSHAIGTVKPDITMKLLDRILHIVIYGYMMIALVDYFRYYQLKVLQVITWCMLLNEAIGSVLQFDARTGVAHPNLVLMINGAIWVVAMICWLVFLFRISAHNFPALNSIRGYVIAISVSIILSGTLPMLIDKVINIKQYFDIMIVVIGVVPYYFIFDFALNLKLKD